MKQSRAFAFLAVLCLFISLSHARAESSENKIYNEQITKAWQTDHKKLGELIKYGNKLAPEKYYSGQAEPTVKRILQGGGTLEEWLAKSKGGPKNFRAQAFFLAGIVAYLLTHPGFADASVSNNTHKVLEEFIGPDAASGKMPKFDFHIPTPAELAQ